jgi:hypothetical protein
VGIGHHRQALREPLLQVLLGTPCHVVDLPEKRLLHDTGSVGVTGLDEGRSRSATPVPLDPLAPETLELEPTDSARKLPRCHPCDRPVFEDDAEIVGRG